MTRLVRAELRKIFTTRMWWGLLIGVAGCALALSLLIALTAGRSPGGGAPSPGVEDPAVVRAIYTAGLGVAYLFALALGITAMSGEFRHQTITSTLLAAPRRTRVVLAKLLALMAVGVGYGMVAVAMGVLAGAPVIASRGGAVRLGSDGVPRALLLAVLAVALWTVLGLGVGTLIRNQVLALMLSVGIAWIVEPLLAFGLNALHGGSVARFFPSQATNALVQPSTGTGGLSITLLPWWAGALVLLGYAVLAGGIGARLTLRRDVS